MPQLDGLRALCLISIVIHHWTIHHLDLEFPFEIGAFLFFSLSGYLITRILLREREKVARKETTYWAVLKEFSRRRALRLLPGYFAAILLYVLLLEPEVLQNVLWYVTNTCNIHFARLGAFPGGADQFWTLAVDQQFYLAWPLVILFCPRRFLPFLLILMAATSPFSRWLAHQQLFGFDRPMMDKLPWFLTDHLCFGSLLAIFHERSRAKQKERSQTKQFPTQRLVLFALFAASLVLYLTMRYTLIAAWEQHLILIFQQTLLALCSTALVGLAAAGFSGPLGRLLEHPMIQSIGQKSYGYYLYHNLALLILGKMMWFLWEPIGGQDLLYPLRLLFGILTLWAMGHYSWKYVEKPFLRRKAGQ